VIIYNNKHRVLHHCTLESVSDASFTQLARTQ
jgi:hypothetical protein